MQKKSNIPIVGEIPRSDEIIRWEDQGKTVIEGDENSEISEKFFLRWRGSCWRVKGLCRKKGGRMKKKAYFATAEELERLDRKRSRRR